MKAGILFEKDGKAQQRILKASTTLADRLQVHPDVLDKLRVQKGDPAVRAMQQREAIADLLEAVVTRVEALPAELADFSLDQVMEKIEAAGVGKVTLQKIREALGGSSD